MLEYGFGKCGGCLSGIFLPWRDGSYTKAKRAKTESGLNGYLDIDGDDPFAMDDELVSLQANNQSSYHNSEWTSGKENYYRDNKPYYEKSVSGGKSNGYKVGTAKTPGQVQRSTESQKRSDITKPSKKDGRDPDEFEKFLQDATQKSEDMKDDVQAYLQTTDENRTDDVGKDIVTSQPSGRTSTNSDGLTSMFVGTLLD